MERTNVEFQKIGVQGVSVLFASGDQGVWGREGAIGSKFHPDFPAGSPYITAVGGTDLATRSVLGEEKAWSGSGGGFSDNFEIPSYQSDFVHDYLRTAGDSLPSRHMWSSGGRGYPDVAALAGTANPYCVAVGGSILGVGGTSAATPVFAGVVAKLNEVRLSKGGAPLGFLNPWLYQTASKCDSCFQDVTRGVNDGGLGRGGFPAVSGWDPATGLGTPNYAELAKNV